MRMCPAAFQTLSSEVRHVEALKSGAGQAIAGACAATHLVSATYHARQSCRDPGDSASAHDFL